MPINVSGFNVPSTPYREYGGTNDFVGTQLLNKRYEHDLRREKEADDWRKLNLIQDLTNLDKYQTGEATADAIGNQKASEILSKYTALAGSLSPAELQGRITEDMQKTIGGMNAMKAELTQSDKDINTLKQLYPSINTSRLRQEHRADILHRRLKGDTDFENPLNVQPSMFDFGNEELLSDYIEGNKGLTDLATKPQTEKRQAIVGTPYNHVEYTAEIPYYMREGFDRGKEKGGFLPNGTQPKLELMSSQIPPEALPSSSGKPFNVIDDEVYRNIGGSQKLELIAEAKKKFPTYTNFTPEEKNLAQRNVLYDFLSKNKSQYYPSQVRTPSASVMKFFSGGSGGEGSETNMNDVYKKIDDTLADMEGKGSSWLPVRNLSPDALEVAVGIAQKARNDKEIGADDLKIIRGNDGRIKMFDKKDEFVAYLPKVPVNIKGNQPLGVKAKQEALKGGGSKKNDDPLGIRE